MRVLVIKTSSMGDVLHALPALTDAKRAHPSLVFDWVVEEGFSEIPGWHSAVEEVVPVAIRRWRKHLWQTLGSTEWRVFKTELRRRHYDLVIDCQGLLKSAWLGSLVKAPVVGYDKLSVREPVATWFYRHKYSVSKQLHAVERIRQLFAQALDYPMPTDKGDYGIDRRRFFGGSPEPANVVFLHATAREDKLYPEAHWRQLAQQLTAEGYKIRLPWGEPHERERAQRIAEGLDGVEVLPRLNLYGVACVLARANAIVAVDTGLGHLSAALSVPTLSLYGPTDPELIGAYGENQYHLCAPSQVGEPAFAQLPPEQVFAVLRDKILATTPTATSMATPTVVGQKGP